MSKVLIISDLHLSDDFNKKKYDFLEKIISDSDRVILNGDFWTYYTVTFDQFLNSEWRGLFPLLLKKQTVYIYGNHDREKYCDKRVGNFSVLQGRTYEFKTEERNDLLKIGAENSEGYMKFWRDFKVDNMLYFAETLLVKIFGRNIYFPGKVLNKSIKEYSKKLDIDYLVVGHTHWSEIDKDNKFINCGLVHSGLANYLVIENSIPRLIFAKYA